MALDRRQLIGAMGALATLGVRVPAARAGGGDDAPAFLGCARGADGRDRAVVAGGDGRVLFETVLPDRGHCPGVSPDGRWAVFPARRPGHFAAVVDLAGPGLAGWFESPADRHFYGHAVFRPDGRTVIATENDHARGRGVLGIWDVATCERLGEMPSHGVGPHQLRLNPDGRSVTVANGGILTRPESGRAKLNIPTMRPNLSVVDLDSGEVTARAEPPADLHKVSLRHFALTPAGEVLVGGQYQGPAFERPPLVARWVPGGPLTFLDLSPVDTARLDNYCGSVVVDPAGRFGAVTSPRGGVGLILDLAGPGRLVGTVRLRDVCGAVPTGAGRFVLTTGTGRVTEVRAAADGVTTRRLADEPARHWDNHLAPV